MDFSKLSPISEQRGLVGPVGKLTDRTVQNVDYLLDFSVDLSVHFVMLNLSLCTRACSVSKNTIS